LDGVFQRWDLRAGKLSVSVKAKIVVLGLDAPLASR
jgi:hypothetical protein